MLGKYRRRIVYFVRSTEPAAYSRSIFERSWAEASRLAVGVEGSDCCFKAACVVGIGSEKRLFHLEFGKYAFSRGVATLDLQEVYPCGLHARMYVPCLAVGALEATLQCYYAGRIRFVEAERSKDLPLCVFVP